MQILKRVEPADATGETKQIFDGLEKNLGMVPNLMRTLANSPAALSAYTSFSSALAGGELSAAIRQQIALAVAQANGCDYCLSAHTAIGKSVGLTPEQMSLARRGDAEEERGAAALRFATELVRLRGRVPGKEVEALKRAGFDDGEIAEIVGAVALNIFTNYFNLVAGTEIDFPVVHATLI